MTTDALPAIRSARRALRLHAPLVLLLAFAVGAVAVIAAAARSLVLTPPPFPQPHELVLVSNRFGHETDRRSAASPPELLDLRERLGSLAALAAVNSFSAALTGREGPAEQLQVGVTSGNFFQVLGVPPLHGRLYGSADDTPLDTRDSANSSILVLSHGLWRRRFGSDPKVIGQLVRVGGTPMRIVGVLPASFRLRLPPGGMTTALDAWTPLRIDYARAPRDGRYLTLIGRLAQDRTLAQASTEAATASRRLREELPDYERAGFALGVEALHAAGVAHLRPILLLLGAAVGTVLALACINSAGMLMARLVARGRELAIRSALGAGPARLLGQVTAEIAVVAVVGTLAGLGIGAVAVRLLRVASFDPELESLTFAFDPATVLLGITIVCLIMIALVVLGALPALRATAALAGGLPDRSGIAGMGKGWRQMRGGLVAGQVALSLLLMVAAGLLLRSSLALRNAPLGFDPSGVATFRISLPFSRYPGPSRWSQRYDELMRELAALPGVVSVGAVDLLPTGGAAPAPYSPVPSGGEEWGSATAVYRTASHGYFTALGVRVSAGRTFTAGDRMGTPPVILVDEVLARRFPSGSALGRRLEVQVEDFTEGYRVARVQAEIVGVVSSVAQERPDLAHQGTIYLPLAQWPTWSVAVAMRTSVPPASVLEPARRAVARLDAELPVYDARLMTEVVRSTFAHTDLALSLVAGLALLALIIAAAGLFGLVAFVVRATTRDQAVRMACGASPRRLLGVQVVSGLGTAGAGVAIGLVMAWPAMRVLGSMLPGMTTTDPLTLAGAAGLVLATAAATTLCAAAAILRIQPAQLLRSA